MFISPSDFDSGRTQPAYDITQSSVSDSSHARYYTSALCAFARSFCCRSVLFRNCAAAFAASMASCAFWACRVLILEFPIWLPHTFQSEDAEKAAPFVSFSFLPCSASSSTLFSTRLVTGMEAANIPALIPSSFDNVISSSYYFSLSSSRSTFLCSCPNSWRTFC